MNKTSEKGPLYLLKRLKQECGSKHILTLASSSSFFLLLTFVPFLLLLMRALGLVFGSGDDRFDIVMTYVAQLVPSHIMGIVDIISTMLKQALFAQGKHTFLNFVFLFISSLGFANSIWRALAIITSDQTINTFKRIIKGLGIISLAFTFFLVVFFLPILINGMSYILNLKYVVMMLSFFGLANYINSTNLSFYGMDVISFFLIVGFFTLIFKYILHPRVSYKSACYGALIFAMVMILLKSSFYLYVELTKNGLMQNYGASYSLVLMFIWILAAMTIFYFSIIFSVVYSEVYPESQGADQVEND